MTRGEGGGGNIRNEGPLNYISPGGLLRPKPDLGYTHINNLI